MIGTQSSGNFWARFVIAWYSFVSYCQYTRTTNWHGLDYKMEARPVEVHHRQSDCPAMNWKKKIIKENLSFLIILSFWMLYVCIVTVYKWYSTWFSQGLLLGSNLHTLCLNLSLITYCSFTDLPLVQLMFALNNCQQKWSESWLVSSSGGLVMTDCCCHCQFCYLL